MGESRQAVTDGVGNNLTPGINEKAQFKGTQHQHIIMCFLQCDRGPGNCVSVDNPPKMNVGKPRDKDENGCEEELLSHAPEAIAAPRYTAENRLMELASLSEVEKSEAYLDVHGCRPADAGALIEEVVDALDFELEQIPPNEGRSLMKARRVIPFLSATSHAQQFLRAENMDFRRTARRMARYWKKREELYGDCAFSLDSVSLPSDEDIARISVKRNSSSSDTHMDKDVRQCILKYLRGWQSKMISDLDRELEKVPVAGKAAFLDSKRKRPDLVVAATQKLLFLRSAGYDQKLAAHRMVNYWQMKYFLFRPEHAFGQLALNELECPELTEGIFHLLPGTDAFGRNIICYRIDKLPVETDRLKRVLQVAWYTLHTAMAKKTAWRNGLVMIVVLRNISIKTLASIDFVNRMAVLLFKSIPLKFRAIHLCMPPESPWFRVALSVVMFASGKEARNRFLVHGGTEEEVLAVLSNKFGISSDQLPSVLGGTLDPNYVTAWLDEQVAFSIKDSSE